MAFCAIGVGIWGIASWMIGLASDPKTALTSWKFAHLGITLIPVFFYQFIHHVAGIQRRWDLIVVYVLGLLGILITTSGFSFSGVRYLFDSFYYPVPTVGYWSYFSVWLTTVGIAQLLLWKKYRISEGIEKSRLRLLFVGVLTGFVGGSMNFMPFFHVDIYPWGNFAIPIAAIIQAYAIFVYKLLDIEILVTKTSLLLATYLVVLGGPFLVGWLWRPKLERWIGSGWWLVPLGLCTVLATIGPFTYAYLRRQAEGRLLREQKRYQRTLQLAARGITQVRNTAKLVHLITRLVSRTVKVTHASLFLWDQADQRYVLRASHGPQRLALQSRYRLDISNVLVQWFQEHRRVLTEEALARSVEATVGQELTNLEAALVIPGFIEQRLIGFLVLGQKLSGSSYSADDLHAFATLANEAAIAIENALSYEELVKVNEQLKAASARLVIQERLASAGQFAAGMAHEIKNPLSAIKTFAQYLPEKYADPAFREKFFHVVQAEIDRINVLVKELSDFAKPTPLQLQAVHLSALLEETLALLSNQCLKQGVEVNNSFRDNGFTVHGDPQQLRQAVLNLLLNSLDAMPSGGQLEVSSRVGGSFLVLRIADTGCGIAPDQLRAIWDPFFTTKERGMGLGLAIVKGIVERHGGTVSISSLPGKGTVAELSLQLYPPRI